MIPSSTPARPPSARDESPPGFQIESVVARGGMGVVYAAYDQVMRRMVAIKVLSRSNRRDPVSVRRFQAEAHITAQLQHPGIPPVYHIGTLADGSPYLVMKLVKGRTLEALLARGEPIDTLAVIEAVAQVVGYAHAHGVIHRDLKPANVMIGQHGEVQVIDWGLAKFLADPEPVESYRVVPAETPTDGVLNPTAVYPLPSDGSDLTARGSAVGTLGYMAPEQAQSDPARVAEPADVYGIGAVLCRLLIGQAPVTGGDHISLTVNTQRGVTAETLAKLDASGAESAVVALCKACLSHDPADRPRDGNEVAMIVTALRESADVRAARSDVHAREQAKRRRTLQRAVLAVAAVFALGAAGTGLGYYQTHEARKLEVAARIEAESKRLEADDNARLATEVQEFFRAEVLLMADPEVQFDAHDVGYYAKLPLREVVVRAARKIDGRFADDPLVEADIRQTLGQALNGMGSYDLAAGQLERVLQLRETHQPADHPQTLDCLHQLAASYHRNIHKRSDAIKLRERVYAARRRSLPESDPVVAFATSALAESYTIGMRFDDARDLERDLFASALADPAATDVGSLMAMIREADRLKVSDRFRESLVLREEIYRRVRASLSPTHRLTLMTRQSLADVYLRVGRYRDAREVMAGCCELFCHHFGPTHQETKYANYVMMRILAAQGDGDELLRMADTFFRHGVTPGHDRPEVFAGYHAARIHRDRGDVQACVRLAEQFEQYGCPDADSAYMNACLWSIAAEARTRATHGAPDFTTEDNVHRAMTWLHKATELGMTDPDMIAADLDLYGLTDRFEFQAHLQSLPPMKMRFRGACRLLP